MIINYNYKKNMANKNSIILAKHVSSDKLTFDGPLANNYGGKYAKVLHNSSWLLVQTPKVVCPFGINVYEETDKNGTVIKKAYSADVSFKGYENDPETNQPAQPKMKELYDMITLMENSLVKHAHKNAFTWVDNPDASEAVCQALLRSGIKWSRDKTTKQINKKYAPRLKLNLPVYEDGMGFKAFLNGKDTPISSIDELLKVASGRCEMVAICKCDRVTFNGGKYGYKWSIQQLKLYSTSEGMSSYAFIEDSDDEEDSVKQSQRPNPSAVQMIEDSDDEEDDELDTAVNEQSLKNVVKTHLEDSDEDEEEEEEAPPPPPKKEKVIKKNVSARKI